MSHHQSVFEKYATPISIIVAGLLIGAGIFLSKGMPAKNTAPNNQENTAPTLDLKKILKGTPVNQKDLTACIENQDTKAKVDNDTKLAQEAGLQGTPHMIILTKLNDSPVQVALPGAQSKDVIEYVIDNGALPQALSDYAANVAKQEITADDHIQGDPTTTKATIIEYSDIDCPFCKRLHPTLQALVDEGKIAWVYRQSPIPQLHPDAYNKAITAECIAKTGDNAAFWKYLAATATN